METEQLWEKMRDFVDDLSKNINEKVMDNDEMIINFEPGKSLSDAAEVTSPWPSRKQTGFYDLCEFRTTDNVTITLMIPRKIRDCLCQKLGNTYKVERYLEARVAEVETLSLEAIKRYLNLMVKKLLGEINHDKALAIEVARSRKQGHG